MRSPSSGRAVHSSPVFYSIWRTAVSKVWAILSCVLWILFWHLHYRAISTNESIVDYKAKSYETSLSYLLLGDNVYIKLVWCALQTLNVLVSCRDDFFPISHIALKQYQKRDRTANGL
jgi:hypothetical protein